MLLENAAEVGRMLHGWLNSLEAEQARNRVTGLTTLLILAYSVSLLAI